MPVVLPPLRDRAREDRLTLMSALLNELQGKVSGVPAALSNEAIERMLGHSWPGNVREMRNVLERAVILARGQSQIGVEHLPGNSAPARPGRPSPHSADPGRSRTGAHRAHPAAPRRQQNPGSP